MSKKSFIKGAAILAVAGLATKFIGALFRIPLTNIIGGEGMAYYQMAYPIYSFLLIVSTAGIPTAISKMVAERIALQNYREAHRIFQLTVKLMLIIGISTFIVFTAGSGITARFVGGEEGVYSILAIAPSLIFVSLISVFRGYFQGMQHMAPTAFSQIVEQAGKLGLGLWLASLYIHKGAAYGAAAAVVGVTLSEGAALALLMGAYRGKRREIMDNIKASGKARFKESNGTILRRVAKIAIPITIGASIMPLVNVADMLMVAKRLMQSGYSEKEALTLYGLLTGSANPLINFPAVLTIALAMSLVPAISESYAGKDYASISQKTSVGIRLTLLMGLPAAAGMAILSYPICALLYGGLSKANIAITSEILAVLSIGVLFLTMVQTLTGILQGLGRVTVPVINLAIGALFKIVITYTLVGNPVYNVKGAAIGSVVCYGIAALLDFAAVVRYSRTPIPFMDFIVKPIGAAAVMSAAVYGVYHYSFNVIGNSKATLLSILAGVIVYAVVLLAIGAVNKQDFELLPGGKKLSRILTKLKLIRN